MDMWTCWDGWRERDFTHLKLFLSAGFVEEERTFVIETEMRTYYSSSLSCATFSPRFPQCARYGTGWPCEIAFLETRRDFVGLIGNEFAGEGFVL